MSQITTHVLDTARGKPANGIAISLARRTDGNWHEIGRGVTNDDGRLPGLCPDGKVLAAGCYRMHFAVADYLEQSGEVAFYPYAEVVFNLDAGGDHYHIPLLLSPYGYSTYRGS